MPGKRATSRVERAIMLLTAWKPDRMGAERARLLNKEQRRPFIVRDQRSEISQISCVLHRQLNGKNPSRYLRGSRPLKGTALRAGPAGYTPAKWGTCPEGGQLPRPRPFLQRGVERRCPLLVPPAFSHLPAPSPPPERKVSVSGCLGDGPLPFGIMAALSSHGVRAGFPNSRARSVHDGWMD